MNQDDAVQIELNNAKKGQGKKLAYLVLAVAAVVIVIAVMVSKMSGTTIHEGSAAMVEAVPTAATPPPDASPTPAL